MSQRKMIESILTPIIGVMPLIIFLLLDFFFPYNIALISGLIAYSIFFFVVVYVLRNKQPYTIYVSAFIFIILIVLVYQLFPAEYRTKQLDRFVYFSLLFSFLSLYIINELIHFFLEKRKLIRNDWLPIVNEVGTVQGRMTLSMSHSSGNKHLHPLVRIVLIHNGMLYLTTKNSLAVDGSKQLDYPFETLLRYKESLDEGVKRAFEENGGNKDLPYSYLFRSLFKSQRSNRLVYLYVSNISNKNQVNQLCLGNGKWWMCKQIEENLGKGLFSGCFEQEYEFLKNTVLMADRLMRMETSKENGSNPI